MCVDVCEHMCHNTHMDILGWVRVKTWIQTCVDICVDMCIGMCTDVRVGMPNISSSTQSAWHGASHVVKKEQVNLLDK